MSSPPLFLLLPSAPLPPSSLLFVNLSILSNPIPFSKLPQSSPPHSFLTPCLLFFSRCSFLESAGNRTKFDSSYSLRSLSSARSLAVAVRPFRETLEPMEG
ncbi:hypothetical protein ABW19_dt0207311 [Dactylella cylindrospora]|nr:hypothetical protein ABW19_dt0207311 [Dactylella cylindrospora]